MNTRQNLINAKLMIIAAMVIYSTIGILVRYIGMSSGFIALMRGVIGALFLLVFTKLRGIKLSQTNIRKNIILLIISGMLMGINWMLLFESYNYTSVAVSTLCYYMAPVFIIIASPFVLKEKLTVKKYICTVFAVIGMVFVSGVLSNSTNNASFSGIFLGLAAAILYAAIILLNKKLKDITPYESTIVQLCSAAIIMLPYALFTTDFSKMNTGIVSITLLIIIGIIHTGIAYVLYFGSISHLKAQTAALFSYIDPILAVLLSTVFLNEPMDIYVIIGALLILSSTFISEINFPIKK